MVDFSLTKVGIISPTPGNSGNDSGHIINHKLTNILLHYHSDITIYTRDTAVMEFDSVNVSVQDHHKPYASSFIIPRILGHVIYQLRFSLSVFKNRKDLDLLIIGGSGFIGPLVIARLLGIHSVYRLGGVVYKQDSFSGMSGIIWKFILKTIMDVNFKLSNNIIVLSPSLVQFAEIEKYKSKIHIWNYYYFDLNEFCPKIPFEDREYVTHFGVSYVKGSEELVESIKYLKGKIEAPILIVGDGDLSTQLKNRANKMGLDIKFTGKIPRDNVPDVMNQTKLLIISSYSEGIPKTAFEAMACGTPVLSTPVGGIPDYIDDGDNGFILEDNSPETIADGIKECLEYDHLSGVGRSSREFMVNQFTYKKKVIEYGEFLRNNTPIDVPQAPKDPKKPFQ